MEYDLGDKPVAGHSMGCITSVNLGPYVEISPVNTTRSKTSFALGLVIETKLRVRLRFGADMRQRVIDLLRPPIRDILQDGK